MTLGILKESDGEQRVAITPDAIPGLMKLGFQKVLVERGAGESAFFSDESYEKQGAQVADAATVFKQSNLLVKIHAPEKGLVGQLSAGQVLIGQMNPLIRHDAVEGMLQAGITAFSLDLAPRTTRAQALDVLSSMATVGGYKAVLTAANHLPTFFPMFMTAAGTIKPAKVLILGAGVAGLQAIATSRRLGAVVEVFDTRPAVKEEVMSLGAKFIEVEGAADASKAGGYAVEQSEEFMKRQKAKIAESVAKADIVITTAQIPGRKAPILITTDMLNSMKNGSVIIDLAAATGGNTEQTKNNETVLYKGVRIVGNSNLPSTMPSDASKLYGKNILNFLQLIITKEGQLNLNFDDDLVLGTCITDKQQVIHNRVKELIN